MGDLIFLHVIPGNYSVMVDHNIVRDIEGRILLGKYTWKLQVAVWKMHIYHIASAQLLQSAKLPDPLKYRNNVYSEIAQN